MKSKITIIAGHPDPAADRLSNAFVVAYKAGAEGAGKQVRVIQLGALDWDPILHKGYKARQELEPCLVQAQQDILWADHLVFCYPTWWGSLPALVKGFFERTFLSGFAFKYHKNSPLWDKLLKGRSARIITTTDGPLWYYRFIVGAPGDKQIKNSLLLFSGVSPVKFTHFGRTRAVDEATHKKWIAKVERLGAID